MAVLVITRSIADARPHDQWGYATTGTQHDNALPEAIPQSAEASLGIRKAVIPGYTKVRANPIIVSSVDTADPMCMS